MDKLLYTFFNKNLVPVSHGKGIYIFSKNKIKFTDLTAGSTGHAILGWSNKKIINQIIKQAKKISHIDYKYWKDENRTLLANKILSNKINKLDRVFIVGSSGAEACEAAIKMSYQIHFDKGKKNKSIIISRKQSYHGCTTHALSIGDRPNLYFYKNILNKNVRKINEHNFVRYKKKNESMIEYGFRSSKDLEKAILRIGPNNVSCFVAETMAGGLVGDVPPAEGYWRNIRKICNKYDVHLILDEVWCGTGVSGKNFCIDYEKITPDFVFLSKTLAAGYGALSAVATKKNLFENSRKKTGQIFYSNTHQGHSLSVAAALACQNIINNNAFLNSVYDKGKFLRDYLNNELSNHQFFKNVRGRGLRNSLEYNCDDKNLFGNILKKRLIDKYKIIIDAKWHRICFSPALIITKSEISKNLEIISREFKLLGNNWTKKNKKNFKYKYF
jgi:adenosylmethionine-8-amino-7-oxononanoate aminotransferase